MKRERNGEGVIGTKSGNSWKNRTYIDGRRSYSGNRYNKRCNMHRLMKLFPYKL